jgi:hypothetical protein
VIDSYSSCKLDKNLQRQRRFEQADRTESQRMLDAQKFIEEEKKRKEAIFGGG